VTNVLSVQPQYHHTSSADNDPLHTASYHGKGTPLASEFTPLSGAIPVADGVHLYVNRGPYSIKAYPGVTQLFSNWTASVDGGPDLLATNGVQYVNWNMQTNLLLKPHFYHNSYIEAAGTYNGLFTNASSDYKISGFVTMKIASNRGYSGTLYVDGNKVSFSGKFTLPGVSITQTIDRSAKFGKGPLTLTFQVYFGTTA